MRRILIFAVFCLVLITSCGKSDDNSKIYTIKIEDKTFKMPIVTTDSKQIVSYLNNITANVKTSKEGDKTVIKAEMSKDQNELFKTFAYYIKNDDNFFEHFQIDYEFQDSNVSQDVKDKVREYFNKNSIFKL